MTVINFHCNKSLSTTGEKLSDIKYSPLLNVLFLKKIAIIVLFSDPVLGKLAFTVEDDCTYVFDLATPLACVENYDRSTCQVEHQGQLYDLNELVITENMDKGEFFLLCHHFQINSQ